MAVSDALATLIAAAYQMAAQQDFPGGVALLEADLPTGSPIAQEAAGERDRLSQVIAARSGMADNLTTTEYALLAAAIGPSVNLPTGAPTGGYIGGYQIFADTDGSLKIRNPDGVVYTIMTKT